MNKRSDPRSPAMQAANHAELGAVVTFAAHCPEVPHWPAEAWQSFAPSEHESRIRRRIFLSKSDQGDIEGLIAVTLTEDITELELLLVHPERRRQGIGRALAEHWLTWARSAGAREAFLEVRASNTGAQQLYRTLGFVDQGLRARYYQHPNEDAVLMGKRLAEDEEPRADRVFPAE